MNVAGPGALIVAKVHKIWERTSHDDRVQSKDALAVYRLLQAVPTADLARRLTALRRSQRAGKVTDTALQHLQTLFGTASGAGVGLAVRATTKILDPDEVARSLVTLTTELIQAL